MSKRTRLPIKRVMLAATTLLSALWLTSANADTSFSATGNETREVRPGTGSRVTSLNPGPADVTPGRDYVEIQGGRPYSAGDSKIEVVEVFGYVCPACARFHPLVSKWAASLPPDVRFQYLPAPWGRDWDPYARGFYVAESMKLVPRTHEALIKAIHVDNTMPGEGESPTDTVVAKFYGKYASDEQTILAQMRSFATDTKMRRGRAFILSSGVEGTPTLIVAGKYRVLGKTYQDTLRIVGRLIDRERSARGTVTRR